jgi:hypothetical protein
MAGNDRWAAARAAKERKRLDSDITLSKRQQKKAVNTVKKSPVLIVVVIALIIGAVAGYFAFTFLSPFEMKDYYVNNVKSSEKDYVIVDMSDLKEDYKTANPEGSLEDFYSSINLKDDGFDCKFFGIDISDTVKTKYYYREDISHDHRETDKIDLKTPGVYYIEYSSSHFAFKNKVLIRTIIITEVENDG